MTKCPSCGAPVERVFHPVAVHFKGSGFYTTDYGRGRPQRARRPTRRSSSDSGGKEKEKAGTKSEHARASPSSSNRSSDSSRPRRFVAESSRIRLEARLTSLQGLKRTTTFR